MSKPDKSGHCKDLEEREVDWENLGIALVPLLGETILGDGGLTARG